MKKLFIAILVFIITLIAALYFSSTEYFFNKYIAPTIKSYNFSYKRVNGSLLSGFKVDDLRYKNNQLASYVEFRFNPFKLLERRVSINKLTLKNVNKKSLKELINDFRKDINSGNSSTSSDSSSISLNFEFKNIYLTFKPFKIKNLEVNKNILKIKEVSYINGKLNLDKNHYFYSTNFGELEFDGEFKKGILNIDKIYLKNFDVDKTLKFISYFDKNNSIQEKNNTSINSNILFLPKNVNIKKLYASLKSFKYKNLDISQAKVEGQDIKIDFLNKKLLEAYLNLSLKTSISDFDTQFIIKNKILLVPELELALLNTNDLIKFANGSTNKKSKNNKTTTSSINLLDFIPLQKVIFQKISFLAKNFSLQRDKIKKITLNFDNLTYDVNQSKLSVKNYNLLLKSTLANGVLNGKINENIEIDKLVLKSDNVNRIIKVINSFDKNSNNSNSSFNILKYIPKKLLVKDAKLNLKKLYFEPYEINKGSLDVKNLLFDLNESVVNKGFVNIKNDSNWGKVFLNGNIKNNVFYAKGEAKVNDNLMKEYKLPLNAKNLKAIKVDGKFSLKDLDLNASLEGKDILTLIKNIDILKSNNRVYYNFLKNQTIWNIDADVKSDFISLAKVKNRLKYANDKLMYNGVIISKSSVNIDKNLNDLLDSLKIDYKGDSKNIDLNLYSKYLQGKLFAKEDKGGNLTIKNIKPIDLYKYTKIKDAKINKIVINAPINFEQFMPLKGKFLIDSNLVNANGVFDYDKFFSLNAKILNSKILAKEKEINKKSIFPVNLDLTFKNDLELKLKNRLLNANMKYFIKKDDLNFEIKSNSFNVKGSGNSKNIKANIAIDSIGKSLKEISKVYKIGKVANVDGKLNIKIDTNFKDLNYKIASNKIVLKNKKSNTEIKDIKIDGIYSNNELIINSYRVNVKDFNFYADRASKIKFQNSLININSFYINNSALISGNYNIKKASGKLKIKANAFKFSNIDYDANLNLDLNVNILNNRYSINGLIDVIRATIKKNLENRNAVDSEDIIILQREAEKKSTFYVKNIKLNLKIKSQKGILYAQDGSYFIAYPKLKIVKNFNTFTKMTGVVNLDQKSHYTFKGKKLFVEKGKITFKGNSSVAYLNILMHYKGREYDIYINVTGTSTRPIVFFSSNPPLTKEQILAYLLFNDTSAAGTHSQESMMNLVGSVLAQSFFGSIGIKIDKLSISQNGFSIGKAINDKVMIYYNQEGQTPSVKARIDITKAVHSVIEVGEEKQSADIIFSKEY